MAGPPQRGGGDRADDGVALGRTDLQYGGVGRQLLALLGERERRVLSLRYGLDRGEPRTPEEVGQLVNLSRERIRQIEARAMSKLRHPSSDTGARDLLTV